MAPQELAAALKLAHPGAPRRWRWPGAPGGRGTWL